MSTADDDWETVPIERLNISQVSINLFLFETFDYNLLFLKPESF